LAWGAIARAEKFIFSKNKKRKIEKTKIIELEKAKTQNFQNLQRKSTWKHQKTSKPLKS
jgi:hypothetical protein